MQEDEFGKNPEPPNPLKLDENDLAGHIRRNQKELEKQLNELVKQYRNGELKKPNIHPRSFDDVNQKEDEHIQELMVKDDPSKLINSFHVSERIQLKAIRKNPENIKYIKKPTFNAQLEALNLDYNVIKYLDIERYPELYTKYYFMCI